MTIGQALIAVGLAMPGCIALWLQIADDRRQRRIAWIRERCGLR